MLTMFLIANALYSITWILQTMQRSAHPLLPTIALSWLLAYLWAPHALLLVAAVGSPLAVLATTLGYFGRPSATTYDGSAFVVPEPAARELPSAHCLTCA